MANYLFGIDVGGTTIKMGLFDKDQGLLEKWEIPTRKENGGSEILSDISESVEDKLYDKDIDKSEVIGIGIGVPGPVTPDGVVHTCVNVGWARVDVKTLLGQKTGIRVEVANDANVAALGECWMGGGKGFKDLVMVTLGTGVGGGIVLGGKILAGMHGAAGEIGHMSVIYDEEDLCNCGKKGCLEQAASATGIVKEANRLLNSSDQPSLLRDLEIVSAKAVFDVAKEGDELAIAAVEYCGKYLGLALAHVATVIDPQVFVIGGGVSKAGDVLIDCISKYYREKAFYSTRNVVFSRAQLGNDAGMYGAARMLLDI